jgi:hypothetical protein
VSPKDPTAPLVPTAALTLPPRLVRAVVRHAPVPEIPLAAVARFVEPVTDGTGRLVDWHLTADLLAAPPADVVAAFGKWRAHWERAWRLGPVSNLVSLVAYAARAAADLGDDVDALAALDLAALGAGVDVILTASDLVSMTAAAATARDLVEASTGTGFAFVDASCRSRADRVHRVVRPDTRQRLTGVPGLEVLVDPVDGLVVRVIEAGMVTEIADIAEVALVGEQVRLRTASGSLYACDLVRGRPLAWLVPGARRWVVRREPLAAVWAEALDGLTVAPSYALVRNVPLRLMAGSHS